MWGRVTGAGVHVRKSTQRAGRRMEIGKEAPWGRQATKEVMHSPHGARV